MHSDWNGNRILNLLCNLALNYHSMFLLNFGSEKSEQVVLSAPQEVDG